MHPGSDLQRQRHTSTETERESLPVRALNKSRWPRLAQRWIQLLARLEIIFDNSEVNPTATAQEAGTRRGDIHHLEVPRKQVGSGGRGGPRAPGSLKQHAKLFFEVTFFA
uniref:Uncharacterized protein n=1 Tax=Calidris pygmaea TaxID=425635 RepID=A0A8C3JS62_9CHAR